jgi:hypothetical protein
MKTDVIRITAGGSGIEEALEQTEKAAVYRGLEPKQALRLRLLAEEMMGMLRTIVGDTQYDYWVETEGKAFFLHLAVETLVNSEMRKELLKSASSGENAAAVGIMGKLKDVFTRMYEPDKSGMSPLAYGFYSTDIDGLGPGMSQVGQGMMYGWSLSEYRNAIEANKEEDAEEWDELERSITANLADEVKIYIRDKNVEMVVEKKF